MPAASDSFFPGMTRNSAGDPARAYWKYEVNHGGPVVVTDAGDTRTYEFGDFTIVIDPVGLWRTVDNIADVYGTMSGFDFSGPVTTSVTETIVLGAGPMQIDDEHTYMGAVMDVPAKGSLTMTTDLTADYAPPFEWCADRNDLDAYPVGTEFASPATATVTGTVTTTEPGLDPKVTDVNAVTNSPETWTIVEKLPAMTVNGVDYGNIVKVERDLMDPEGQLRTYTYWLAKGIGPVKIIGMITVDEYPSPIDIDLVETNLVQGLGVDAPDLAGSITGVPATVTVGDTVNVDVLTENTGMDSGDSGDTRRLCSGGFGNSRAPTAIAPPPPAGGSSAPPQTRTPRLRRGFGAAGPGPLAKSNVFHHGGTESTEDGGKLGDGGRRDGTQQGWTGHAAQAPALRVDRIVTARGRLSPRRQPTPP